MQRRQASQKRAELSRIWTEVDGLRIHARVSTASDRRPLVLVHGLVVSSLYMIPTAVRLTEHFRVFIPDLPGFGDSSKPPRALDVPELARMLAGWMEAHGLGPVPLVGNSLGCQVIADLAVRYPHLVSHAVLIGPTVDPRNRRALRQIARLAVDGFRERMGLGLIHVRDYGKAGLRRATQTFRYSLEDRIEQKLPCLSVPTLVVRGARDLLVPQRWAEEAVQALPDGQLAVIPGAPHATNYSAPLETARVIRLFLEDRPPARIISMQTGGNHEAKTSARLYRQL